MKGHEWASEFTKAFNGDGDVFKALDDFVKEAIELIVSRTEKSEGARFVQAAVVGAVGETKAKWLSIQARCPRLKAFGFDQVTKQIKKLAPNHCFKYVTTDSGS